MLPSRAAIALALGPLALGCGHAQACAAGRTCGDARWLDDLVVVDGREVVAQAVAVAVPGLAESTTRTDALPVSSRRAYVRFDLSQLASASGVERAVLSLAPHPAWRANESPSRLVVRGVLSGWTPSRVASGDAPALDEEVATATLPAGVRAPLRVDVTAMVRAWVERRTPAEGVALEVDGGAAVFVGTGSAELASRPRLEVVVR